MWDLKKEAQAVLEQVESIGIAHGEITGFYIKYNKTGYWGMCRLLENGKYEIYINGRLLSGDIPVISLRTTLAHEILHSCPGCMNHGRLWKENCKKMELAFGYRIGRTASAYEQGVPDKTQRISVAEKLPPERVLQLEVGDFVVHDSFGPGVVIAIQQMGTDALVKISFQSGEVRQLMKKRASLYMQKGLAPISEE